MGLAASTLCDRLAALRELAPLLAYVGADRQRARALVESSARNDLFLSDMYKYGHHQQLPEGVTGLYEYFEARPGAVDEEVLWFGPQFLLEELSAFRVTEEHVREASLRLKNAFMGNGEVFNEAGWLRIAERGGRLPIEIRALPEGSIVRPGTPLLTVENTDPDAAWVAAWVESWLSQVWYPTTVASLSYHYLKLFIRFLVTEGCCPQDAYGQARLMMVDFGMRGSTSMTSAKRGGAAVLTCFDSSDNTAAGIELERVYHGSNTFFSVPATEHCVMTSYGPGQGEVDACRAMLDKYPIGIVSVVSDSYDYEICLKNVWCGVLRDEVMVRYQNAIAHEPDAPHFLVIRPDSGDMIKNILMSLTTLEKAFGSSKNSQGYKVLHPCVRLIQGDGVNRDSLAAVLEALHYKKWSVTNLVFGSGGGLLQNCSRDTERFAMKASWILQDGKEKNICKMTPGKQSKRGRLTVALEDGEYKTYQEGQGDPKKCCMELRFRDGVVYNSPTLSDIRERVKSSLV